VNFSPGFTLTPTFPNNTCIIDFTFDVIKTATKDADTTSQASSGIQTAALAGASALDAVTSTPGGGIGAALISFPAIVTTPGPGGVVGQVTLTDSAVIDGLVRDPVTNDPATGRRLVTPLGDLADLENGFNPTGTITFRLFAPSDPTCTAAIFTNAVAVNGNGLYHTSANAPASLITQTGTYQWTAVYGGDANNNSAVSVCGAEPVVISQPVLAIVKTPDGTTYHAGDTISFSIVVTNNGPGTAVNVRFSPLDALPDPNASLSWAIGTPAPSCTSGPAPVCSVTGPTGSQTLGCSFGDLA